MDLTRHNTKFGILAFDNCAEVPLNAALDLGDGITVHPACPIDLPEHWRTWLGTLQTGYLVDANLAVCVQIDSATPTDLDGETKQLEKRLSALRLGLFLHGIPDYRNDFIVLGGVDADGSASVRRVSRPQLAYRHRCGRRPQITADTLMIAKECANGILGLCEHPSTFRRLRAGFHACTRGMEERSLDDRLHQYVRALDGLMRSHGLQGHQCRIVKVIGESIEPTLPDGASILVNMGQRDPRDGRIFVVRSEGELIVKRLIRDPNAGWLIQSDNPNKRAWPTRGWPDDAQIVGEVKWVGRSFT